MGRRRAGDDFGFEEPTPSPTPIDDFAAFHVAHPEVYEEFRRRATQALERGFAHYSPDRIIHAARWDADMALGPKRAVRVNDKYTKLYALLLVEREPRFEGFFITRTRS